MENKKDDVIQLFKENSDYLGKKLVDCEAMIRQMREEMRRYKEEVAQMEARLATDINRLETAIGEVTGKIQGKISEYSREVQRVSDAIDKLINNLKHLEGQAENLRVTLQDPRGRELHVRYLFGYQLWIIVGLVLIIGLLAAKWVLTAIQ